MLSGDFNLIADPSDKSNDRINRAIIGRFGRLIPDLELQELYLNGWRYTWLNERLNPIVEKLNHVLTSMEWEPLPSSFISSLRTNVLDRCPLHLLLDPDHCHGRRFHFESFWTKVDGFQEMVMKAWNSAPTIGNPFKPIMAMLKRLTRALARGSDIFIGNIKLQIFVANEVILRLDMAMESRQLYPLRAYVATTYQEKVVGFSFIGENDCTTEVAHPLVEIRGRLCLVFSTRKPVTIAGKPSPPI